MPEDRPGSILTGRLERFVKGEEPAPNRSLYNKRVRRRIEYALVDLATLFEHLREEERRKIFGPHYGEIGDPAVTYGQLSEGQDQPSTDGSYAPAYLPKAFAFFVWALNVNDDLIYPPFDERQPAFEGFEKVAAEGVKEYLFEKHDLLANVDVSIELDNVDRSQGV